MSRRDKLVSITWNELTKGGPLFFSHMHICYSVVAYMTYRMLKRATMILEIVKENKLVDNLFSIQKVFYTMYFQAYKWKVNIKFIVKI